MSDFGAGIRAPRHGQLAAAGAAEEQRILDDDPSLGVGNMGELERCCHIAAGVDPGVRRAQAIVHQYTAPFVLHASLSEAEAFDVRSAADRHEKLVDDDLVVFFVTLDAHDDLTVALLHALDSDAELQIDAIVDHRLLHDGGRIGILARQHVVGPLEQRHAAAEPGEGLRQLAADRTGADDAEPRR